MIHAIYIPLIFVAYFLGLGTIYYSRSQRSYRRARREFQRSLDTIGWDCGMNTTRLGKITDEDREWAENRIKQRFIDDTGRESKWMQDVLDAKLSQITPEMRHEIYGNNPDVVDEGPDDNL